MYTPKKDKQGTTTSQNAQKAENVYQGISVEKFLSILKAKGWDPKDTEIKVYYKNKLVR